MVGVLAGSIVHFDFSVPTNSDNITLGEIQNNLEQNLKQISNLAQKVHGVLANRPVITCNTNDKISYLEGTHKILDYVKHDLDDIDENVFKTVAENWIDVYKMLVTENEQQSRSLEYAIKELRENKLTLAELKETYRLMEVNMNNLDTPENKVTNTVDTGYLKRICRRTFQLFKRNLHNVLDSFDDKSLKQLIQNLTEAYFKGGDNKYIEVTEELFYPHLELLKESSLVVEDPYENKRVKFDDFI